MLIDLDDGIIDMLGEVSTNEIAAKTHIKLNVSPMNKSDPYFLISA
jgi:hypothetical protein